MSQRRILQLLHEPGDSVATMADEYTRALDRTQFQVTIAYLFSIEDPVIRAASPADTVIFCDFPRRERGGLRCQALAGLRRLCLEGHYDTIICHRHKAAYLVAWLARRWKCRPRLIYVVHGTQPLSHFPGLVRRWMMHWLIHPQFEFIAVSEALRQDFLRSYRINPAKITTVHNSLHIPALDQHLCSRAEARQILGLPLDACVFGNIGRLVPFKHQLLLLQAFASIASSLETGHLIIIGAGPCQAELRAYWAQLPSPLQARIHLHGVIPNAARLMPAFDAFVLSSLDEPFGLVLLEAMCAHLPIIAHASGGVPEVLGDTALMLHEHSASAFAQAMLQVAAWPMVERTQRGELSRARLEARFAMSQVGTYLAQPTESVRC